MVKNEEIIIFKILFDIKFNGKNFTILIDKHRRRIFLQKDINGNYIYPKIYLKLLLLNLESPIL